MIKLWKEILFSPSEGYAKLDRSAPVWKPLLMVMLLTALVMAMLTQVMMSQEYKDLVFKLSVEQMQQRGQTMSAEQLDSYREFFYSSGFFISSLIGNTLGTAVTSGIICLLGALLLWLISLAFKTGENFKRALAVVVYAYPVLILGMAVKNLLVIASDYRAVLGNVKTAFDFSLALSPPFSLASFLSASSSPVLYAVINSATDVFLLLFVFFVYTACLKSYGMDKKKAVISSVIFYVVTVLVSIISLLPTLKQGV